MNGLACPLDGGERNRADRMGPRHLKESFMELFDIVGLACAAGLFAYMLYALFKPERF